LIVPAVAACEPGLKDGSGPRVPRTCVLKADNPHYSTTAHRRGLEEIVGKGRFSCSVRLQDATLSVELQRLDYGDWDREAGQSLDVQPVQPRRTYVQPVAIGCRGGRFRTRVRLSAHDQHGEYSRSQWYYSSAVTDPCKRR
jgi:hypothetical protein